MIEMVTSQEMVFNGHRVVLSQSRVNIDWDEIKNRFRETKNLSKEFIEDYYHGYDFYPVYPV